MKQEPVKKMKLPKYAAALAALTVSTGMMTACHEPQYEGAVPTPVETTQYKEPDIGGEVACEPEPEASAATELLTTAAVTEAEQTCTQTFTIQLLTMEEIIQKCEPRPELMGLVPQVSPEFQQYLEMTAGEEAQQ